jgi:hypothetical protein
MQVRFSLPEHESAINIEPEELPSVGDLVRWDLKSESPDGIPCRLYKAVRIMRTYGPAKATTVMLEPI